MSEIEYSKEELAVLQAILDMFRAIPEAPLIGSQLRFNKNKEEIACLSLRDKKLAEITHYEEDPKGSISIGVNEAGAQEMVRLFKAGILTKYEDREPTTKNNE